MNLQFEVERVEQNFSRLSMQNKIIDNAEYPKSNTKVPPTDVSNVIES